MSEKERSYGSVTRESGISGVVWPFAHRFGSIHRQAIFVVVLSYLFVDYLLKFLGMYVVDLRMVRASKFSPSFLKAGLFIVLKR